jgi:hypothetical protein
MKRSDFKWYVYELYEPDTELVFYIGKGSGNRIDAHEIEAKSGVSSHKCNKIRSVISRCGKIGKRKVAYFSDEKHSYIHEANRIAEHGIDNLTNVVLYTALVKAKNKKNSGANALSLIKKFIDRFVYWMRVTDGGKNQIYYTGERTMVKETTELFYNSLCPSIMQRAIDSIDTREKFIELMRKYKLEINYVPA